MKYLKNNKKLLWFVFSLGIILIITGIVLVILYFHREVLDDKYIVQESTSYEPKNVALKNGEVVVTRNIKYISKGEYKITYKTKLKNSKNINLLEDNTTFTITDVIGDSYILKSNKVFISGNEVKIINNFAEYGEFKITYKDNTFEITYPSYRVKNNNTVEIYVKLTKRTTNQKHEVSKDAYYTLTPSSINSFYTKKTSQSYIIEGTGYIVLKNK